MFQKSKKINFFPDGLGTVIVKNLMLHLINIFFCSNFQRNTVPKKVINFR